MIEAAYGLAREAGAIDAQTLAESYGNWVGVLSNHVIDSAGNFQGPDGSSRSISTEEDRQLLVALRSRASLIVVDAATARRERYRMPSAKASLAIFSQTGDFSSIPAVAELECQTYLFSPVAPVNPNSAKNSVHVQIQAEPFVGFLDWARGNNYHSILLEAGPTLTQLAFKEGIVDRSAVTRTPRISTEVRSQIQNPFDGNARLISLAHSSDASFTLWQH